MAKIEDLTGKKFGRWTVIKRVENNKNGDSMWLCQCSCDKHTLRVVRGGSLRQGKSTSCGCIAIEKRLKCDNIHGHSGERIYTIWHDMKQRCENPNDKYYHNYGGRGIKTCSEWKNSFQAFYNWSIVNGYKENLTLDRIDGNKGYSPDNCRWVTRKFQANNTRRNVILKFNEVSHTMVEWSDILDISYMALCHRIERGWSIERALTTPVQKKKSKGDIKHE